MLVIDEEINARENSKYSKLNDFQKKELNNQFVNSFLHAQIKVRKCIFCKNEDHYSDQCKMITDLNLRREILSKGKSFFNCLKPGHIKKNWKGSHPTALCFSKNGTSNTFDGKNNHPNTFKKNCGNSYLFSKK